MCLLVSQPATTKFDDAFIKGVYNLNSDGLGVMYAEDSSLFIRRIVPTTEEEFVKFFRENVEGRACAWHARMKTHGHIDLTNCHPYQVISAEEGYPLYLAHNGVLHTGNNKDKSKSDTWHFIQDYLRPMLLKNPEFFMTEAFSDLIGDFIGTGNKFILMDAYGNTVTINEDQGVQHKGAWLSNTYAWDTEGTEHDVYGGGYGYRSKFSRSAYSAYKPNSYYGVFDKDDKDDLLSELTSDMPDEVDEWSDALFKTMNDFGLKCDQSITKDDAEIYFLSAGYELAWEVIEAIEFGAYTRAEIIDEITFYSKAAA